eukprot:scaffold11206_cov117-Isochrysis_galbana.AAC.10
MHSRHCPACASMCIYSDGMREMDIRDPRVPMNDRTTAHPRPRTGVNTGDGGARWQCVVECPCGSAPSAQHEAQL